MVLLNGTQNNLRYIKNCKGYNISPWDLLLLNKTWGFLKNIIQCGLTDASRNNMLNSDVSIYNS